MKNISSSFKYIFNNFLMVLLFTLIPAIFMGSFYNMFGLSNFVAHYISTTVNELGSILSLLFDFSFNNFLFFVLGSIMLVLFISAFIGNIENHFRSGKLNLNNTSYYINNNVLAVTTYYLFTVALMMFYKFLLGILLFTTHVIFSGLKNTPTTFTFVIAIVLLVSSFVLFAYLLNYILLGLPVTLFNGYNVRTSLSDASELLNKKHTQTTVGLLLPFSLVFFLMVLGQLFSLTIVTNIIVALIVFALVPVYSFVCYYDYSALNRYDNKGKYYFK